jgi:hypothetical protein
MARNFMKKCRALIVLLILNGVFCLKAVEQVNATATESNTHNQIMISNYPQQIDKRYSNGGWVKKSLADAFASFNVSYPYKHVLFYELPKGMACDLDGETLIINRIYYNPAPHEASYFTYIAYVIASQEFLYQQKKHQKLTFKMSIGAVAAGLAAVVTSARECGDVPVALKAIVSLIIGAVAYTGSDEIVSKICNLFHSETKTVLNVEHLAIEYLVKSQKHYELMQVLLTHLNGFTSKFIEGPHKEIYEDIIQYLNGEGYEITFSKKRTDLDRINPYMYMDFSDYNFERAVCLKKDKKVIGLYGYLGPKPVVKIPNKTKNFCIDG